MAARWWAPAAEDRSVQLDGDAGTNCSGGRFGHWKRKGLRHVELLWRRVWERRTTLAILPNGRMGEAKARDWKRLRRIPMETEYNEE